MVIKRKIQRKLGEVNFLGRPIQPAFKHKHSQPIFGFKPFKPSKPQPIKGYPGINMFSSIAIPQRQSTSLWNASMKAPAKAMWGDSDGDGVYNGFDCQPRNARMQGPEHKKKTYLTDIYNLPTKSSFKNKEEERRAANKLILKNQEKGFNEMVKNKGSDVFEKTILNEKRERERKQDIDNKARAERRAENIAIIRGQIEAAWNKEDQRRGGVNENAKYPNEFDPDTAKDDDEDDYDTDIQKMNSAHLDKVLKATKGNKKLAFDTMLGAGASKQVTWDKGDDYVKTFDAKNFDGVEFGEIPYEERRAKAEKEWVSKGSPTPEYDYEEDYDKAEGRAEKRRREEHEGED